MNSLAVVVGALAFFVLAYRKYGALLERVFGKGVAKGAVAKFDEEAMRPAPLRFDNGYKLMGYFLK